MGLLGRWENMGIALWISEHSDGVFNCLRGSNIGIGIGAGNSNGIVHTYLC